MLAQQPAGQPTSPIDYEKNAIIFQDYINNFKSRKQALIQSMHTKQNLITEKLIADQHSPENLEKAYVKILEIVKQAFDALVFQEWINARKLYINTNLKSDQKINSIMYFNFVFQLMNSTFEDPQYVERVFSNLQIQFQSFVQASQKIRQEIQNEDNRDRLQKIKNKIYLFNMEKLFQNLFYGSVRQRISMEDFQTLIAHLSQKVAQNKPNIISEVISCFAVVNTDQDSQTKKIKLNTMISQIILMQQYSLKDFDMHITSMDLMSVSAIYQEQDQDFSARMEKFSNQIEQITAQVTVSLNL